MKLSEKLAAIQPSLTLGLSAKAKALQAKGVDVINFGAGEPDFDTPDNIKAVAKTELDKGFTKYTATTGIIELKQAVCDKFHRENGLEYKPENIIISCGAKHSLYNTIMAITNPGDEVILPGPYWVSYYEQILLAGGKPVIANTDETTGFKLTPDLLKKYLSPKTVGLILTSPSNPTGAMYTMDELKVIADIVLSHPNAMVISDEIYEKIFYGDFKPVSIASLSPEIQNRTIIINGVSKTYSMTGWRIGYLASTDTVLIKTIGNFQDHVTSNPVSFAQKAAVAALNSDLAVVNAMVSEFKTRRDYIVAELNKIPGVKCFLPQGAFYAFPNIAGVLTKKYNGSGIQSSLVLSELLLQHAKLAVVPGIAFGANNYLRFSYATSMKNIVEGIKRFAEFVNKLV
ncbi:MAG: pyridoxal phosphate-dependent aminotransferase [Elusimicrobiota bacterium]